jgi:LEA14-like dessication related protein
MQLVRASLMLFVAFLLSACNGLGGAFQQPEISITSFALAPGSTGLAPVFNIGLRVVNPNRSSLPLRGMTYSVEVDGNRVLNGASPDLPTVRAYDTADILIEARPDLLGSARLLSDLFARQRSSLGYTFRARIDLGGLLPFVNVEESGNFGLPGTQAL